MIIAFIITSLIGKAFITFININIVGIVPSTLCSRFFAIALLACPHRFPFSSFRCYRYHFETAARFLQACCCKLQSFQYFSLLLLLLLLFPLFFFSSVAKQPFGGQSLSLLCLHIFNSPPFFVHLSFPLLWLSLSSFASAEDCSLPHSRADCVKAFCASFFSSALAVFCSLLSLSCSVLLAALCSSRLRSLPALHSALMQSGSCSLHFSSLFVLHSSSSPSVAWPLPVLKSCPSRWPSQQRPFQYKHRSSLFMCMSSLPCARSVRTTYFTTFPTRLCSYMYSQQILVYPFR